jgi:two-component system heavy metal sensor histidine kinase CusS
MSSKTASPDATATARRPWSLAVRLAVGYGAAAFTLLLIATAYSYWALADTLDREDVSFLREEVGEVHMILNSKPDGLGALREHFHREIEAHLATPLFLRVLDGSGETIASTVNMDSLVPPARFPLPGQDAHPATTRVSLDDGKHFELMSMRVQIDGRPMTIHGAMDLSLERRLLARYGQHMAIVLLAGLVACAVTGYIVARRGLHPLSRMAAVIEPIGSSSLDQRLDDAGVPGELSKLAAAFNVMLQRLEDAFARLSRFSADIAHELRTPIHNVRGMVEVTLANKHRSEEDQRRLLVPCLEECHRLSRLIDNLLFVARAENPQTQIKRTAVNVNAELEKVQEFYEAAAADAGVTLEVSGDGSSEARAALDRQLFQQAMCNLVENALAHTPSGGKIKLSAAQVNGTVRVEVVDTGAGIPAEHLPFVFDRFHRVDASRSKHTGGMGLGLALVKSIATLHGGSATVESRVGAGSRFILKFPTNADEN